VDTSKNDDGRQPLLILVNAARGEAVLSMRSTRTSETTRAEYQRVTYRVIFTDPSIDMEWLKGAKLIRYELKAIRGVSGALDANLPAAVKP
jgi:hypothetical protein